MKCYGYTRVSTVKQGEHGVSLQEQRAAIERYAERSAIEITEWFEERLTAAKQGRPLFNDMLTKLRAGKAHGVVIHKIDRSARNLRDWADLGELIDGGVAIHFANESVDLQSRGGRLSADIQAVVAADYVRNLREETLKGIRGRLKQGIYPFQAPLGYLNTGGGNPKAVDPTRGHLIREAFDLYASGRHTLDSLAAVLERKGLTGRSGGRVNRNHLSQILNNPFYAGVIRIRRSGETYPGRHVPLVSMALFKAAQHQLARRVRTIGWTHEFTFRGLFRCSLCNRYLTGELQKGHVYYRCHTRHCPTKTFREDHLEAAVLRSWPAIAHTDEEKQLLAAKMAEIETRTESDTAHSKAQLRARLGAGKERLARLVDALLDGVIDKSVFEERKRLLLEEERLLTDALDDNNPGRSTGQFGMDAFELATSAQQSYRLADALSRRELLLRLSSNLSVAGRNVVVEPSFPVQVLAKRRFVSNGGLSQDATRTSARLAWHLWSWARRWQRRSHDLRSALEGGRAKERTQHAKDG